MARNYIRNVAVAQGLLVDLTAQLQQTKTNGKARKSKVSALAIYQSLGLAGAFRVVSAAGATGGLAAIWSFSRLV